MKLISDTQYRALIERAERNAALLCGERTARAVAEQCARDANALIAQLAMARRAQPAPADQSTDASADSPRSPQPELTPALRAVCDAYGFGNPAEIVANRRLARRLLAQDVAERQIIARVIQGASPPDADGEGDGV